MSHHPVVSHAEWLEARTKLLAREKEFDHTRDALSAARRDLPWEKVEKNYVFEDADGKESLADLFGDKSQLVVYHLMFAPDWEAACKNCSFWADDFNGMDVHLAHRDIAFAAISRAPYAKLAAYKKRMGWSFHWVSCAGNGFNYDYHVSFRPDEAISGKIAYNYKTYPMKATDMPGISVFAKDAAGAVFHTYSTYSRGIDMMNGTYHYIDLTPKGRDEDGRGMFWVKRHDEYKDQ